MVGVRGKSILVVGASSGIGLALATAAVAGGADVTIAGRRRDVVESEGARIGAYGVACDVREDRGGAELVDAALARWGRIDGVVYAAGVSPLVPLAEATTALWHDVLGTVLVGASQVARAAVAPLVETGGRLVLLSSNMVGKPWPGMVPYAAARSALEELARGLRVEHPALDLTVAVIGPTATGFQQHWEPAAASAYLERWRAERYLPPGYVSLRPEEVADALVGVLASPVRLAHISIQPNQRPV